MKTYEAFAPFYDGLTNNVDYAHLSSYFDKIIKENGNGGNLLLDLACGTGSLSFELADKGYDVISVDASEQMLSEAMRKPHTFGNPTFLNQTMQNLDLFGTIDAAVCCLDSINHLSSKVDVKRAIGRVALFMNAGGLFIFDVNTIYKHREILGDNTFVYDTDDVYCVWQNAYCQNDGSVEISLDFFKSQKNGTYLREQESFCEYIYDDEFLTQCIKQ
ncbi:MAG: methyltransferase domain-containing protein, partial [Oscillospiraceae bacterium]|nr:methyltransferase domain-containing protein [Oscillospiraceae bacterium]